jgi:hypothetical protein
LVSATILFVIVGIKAYYIALIITGISMSVFMMKTLKRYTHFNANNEFGPQNNLSQTTLLYILGGLQIPLLLIIGYN